MTSPKFVKVKYYNIYQRYFNFIHLSPILGVDEIVSFDYNGGLGGAATALHVAYQQYMKHVKEIDVGYGWTYPHFIVEVVSLEGNTPQFQVLWGSNLPANEEAEFREWLAKDFELLYELNVAI